ncbi:MAG: UDP-2,3-diacylglucosamine diphosphatase [Bdellovibrionales bacterium]
MFIFVSDVHLDKPQSKRYGAFLRLLDEIKEDESIKEFFLVGDIFDLWVGDRSAFIQKHKVVLEKIRKIAKLKKVHYFEGNHDFQLGVLWKDMGVEVYPDEHEFNLKGQRVLVSHGDLLDQSDKNYLRMRWFFRTPFARFLIKILPEVLLVKIGSLLSTTEHKELPTKEEQRAFQENWEKWTRELHSKKPYDVFICGHFHFNADLMLPDLDSRAVNLGTWLNGEFSVFEL